MRYQLHLIGCIISTGLVLLFMQACGSDPITKTRSIREDFDTVNARRFDEISDSIDKLNIEWNAIQNCENPLKNLLYVFDMHYQVMNGGLLQFVDNGSGDHFEETLIALKELKANEFVSMLEEIKAKFPEGVVPKNMEERRTLIDKLNKQLDKEDQDFFERLDMEYFSKEDKLHKSVIEYLGQYDKQALKKSGKANPDYSSFSNWFGHYSHFRDGVITNGVSVGMVEYTVDLNDTLCLFKGSGYQVYFEYLCRPEISGDTLFLHEERDVSYGDNKPAEKEYGTLLIRKKKNYFLISQKPGDEKLKMKKSTEKPK